MTIPEVPDDIKTIITGIAGVAWNLYERWKRKKEVRERDKADEDRRKRNLPDIENYNNVQTLIIHITHNFRMWYQPTRVFIIHFHNGTKTLADHSLHKMTFLHELRLNHEVEEIEPKHQNTAVTGWMHILVKEVRFYGFAFLKDRHEVKDKVPVYYNWLVHYGVKSQYCIGINSVRTGNLAAILCLQFDRPDPLSEEDLTQIQEEKKRIEEVYDVKKDGKNNP